MAKRETPPTTPPAGTSTGMLPPSPPPPGDGSEIQIRLTRRTNWNPSPRLPDYMLEDDLNRLMDPREWKVYRALWRHSIGLRNTPLITAGYAEVSEMTGLSRASVIRALKGLMKKRFVVRLIGPEAKGEDRLQKSHLPGKPRDGHRYLVCTYREVLEGRLRDGTVLKDIPEGGLYPEEVQIFRREEQESLFPSQ
jgi:DNA-binding MarR family transcriptional regulator